MPDHICENCERVFKQKGHLATHQKRKNPCKKNDTIEKIVERKVNEALKEIGVLDTDESNDVMKPVIKWVGGKTQILDKVLAKFPRNIQNYHEPFTGGGSVLLGLLSSIQAGVISVSGNIYASDLNENLIGLYKNIQTNPVELIEQLKKLSINTEEYYYSIRSSFNQQTDRMSIETSAMFIYLNKTCFRGIYREGPNGFNVPFGHYKNPKIVDEEHILAVSDLIKPVVFTHGSFDQTLEKVESGDFVYLDPPYAPETNTSFVSYNSGGFGLETHQELFRLCNTLNDNGVSFLMSNADVSLVKNVFPSPTYITDIISCRRAINSKNPESRTNEVLISTHLAS